MKGSTFKERFDRWKNGESYWDIVGSPLATTKNNEKDNDLYDIDSSSSGSFKGYVTANQNTGELTTRNKNGDIVSKNGSILLPEVTIKPQKYSSAFDPNGAELFYDVATLGLVPNPFKLVNLLSNGNLKGAAGTTLLATSFGSGMGGALSRALVGTHNLAGNNGVSKTYNLFKNGLYGLGIKSGIGDILDVAMSLDGGKYIENNAIGSMMSGTKKLLGRRAAIAAYNNIDPFVYYGHLKEMLKAVKQFITPGKLNIIDKDPISSLMRQSRDEIFKKYLGLGEANYFYKDTGKFDSNGYPIWTYDLDHIPESNKLWHMELIDSPYRDTPVIADELTTSGGYLMGTVKNSANGPVHVYDDIWDLQPLLNLPNFKLIPNKVMDKIRNFEVSSLVGDKPVHVINEIPIEPYNPGVAREWLDIFTLRNLLGKNINSNKYKGGKDSVSLFVSTFRPMLYNTLQKKGYHTNSMDNMLTQLAWESNYGKSNNAKVNNNYGGIKNGSGYANYLNPLDFIDHYVDLIHDRYPNAFNSTDLNSYAKSLKDNGYYEDSLSHYSSNLNNMKSLRKAIDNERINNLSKYNNTLSYDLIMSEQQDAIQTHKPNIVLTIPLFKQKKQPKQIIYPNYILQPNLLPNIMDIYLNAVNGRNPLTIPGQ